MCVCFLQKSEEGIGFPETGVIDSCCVLKGIPGAELQSFAQEQVKLGGKGDREELEGKK